MTNDQTPIELCGSRGFAGPTACILKNGHDGDHKYGDFASAVERQTPTPRTDAAKKLLGQLHDQYYYYVDPEDMAKLEHDLNIAQQCRANELESHARELSRAQEELAETRKQAVQQEHYAAGIAADLETAQEELAALRSENAKISRQASEWIDEAEKKLAAECKAREEAEAKLRDRTQWSEGTFDDLGWRPWDLEPHYTTAVSELTRRKAYAKSDCAQMVAEGWAHAEAAEDKLTTIRRKIVEILDAGYSNAHAVSAIRALLDEK